MCPCAFCFGASPAASHPSEDEVQNKCISPLPLPFLALLQQVASQTVKTRPPSFSMGTFQGTSSSFSTMTAPGSTASPTGAAYPNLAGRGTGFSEYGLGRWGGLGWQQKSPWRKAGSISQIQPWWDTIFIVFLCMLGMPKCGEHS